MEGNYVGQVADTAMIDERAENINLHYSQVHGQFDIDHMCTCVTFSNVMTNLTMQFRCATCFTMTVLTFRQLHWFRKNLFTGMIKWQNWSVCDLAMMVYRDMEITIFSFSIIW